MRTLVLFCIAAIASQAQVAYNEADHTVSIDGKPFTTFYPGEDANKPYLSPLRSASGKVVTRMFPMEKVEGESRDHLHHRGLWFSYDEVNDVKFWENDPSYKRGVIGKIVVTKTAWKGGKKQGTMTNTMEWRAPDGKVEMVEQRETTFSGDAKLRVIDFKITLTAAADEVKLGDTKEGAFAIRLAEPFTGKRGGKMVNADGAEGMKAIWGKRSNWVDYTAEVGGERLGVAIFDHPSSYNHPTRWHARDYGLFALNPFGQKSFDPAEPAKEQTLKKGEKLHFRWRVVIHPGDAASAGVAGMYEAYAKMK